MRTKRCWRGSNKRAWLQRNTSLTINIQHSWKNWYGTHANWNSYLQAAIVATLPKFPSKLSSNTSLASWRGSRTTSLGHGGIDHCRKPKAPWISCASLMQHWLCQPTCTCTRQLWLQWNAISPNELSMPYPCQGRWLQHMGFSYAEGATSFWSQHMGFSYANGVLSFHIGRSLPHAQNVHEGYKGQMNVSYSHFPAQKYHPSNTQPCGLRDWCAGMVCQNS